MDLHAPSANDTVAQRPTAPKANGSNGGIPSAAALSAPSGLGAKADQWVDRQVRGAMKALGNEPLVSGL